MWQKELHRQLASARRIGATMRVEVMRILQIQPIVDRSDNALPRCGLAACKETGKHDDSSRLILFSFSKSNDGEIGSPEHFSEGCEAWLWEPWQVLSGQHGASRSDSTIVFCDRFYIVPPPLTAEHSSTSD